MFAIAIEGRVSHSKGLLIAEQRNDIHLVRSMGLEWREMPTGTKTWALHSLLNALAEKYSINLADLVNQTRLCVVAVSGIDPRYGVEGVTNAMKLYGFKSGQILLSSLAEIGHLGAFLGNPGVLIRCGHGVSAFIKTDKGEHRLVSGWGRIVSDEGGGHWLGSEVLAATARVIDGRATLDERKFVDELLKKMKVSERISLFLQMENSRALGGAFGVCQYLTDVGHTVVQIAEEGDDYANLLINRAHRAIIDTIGAALSGYSGTQHRIQFCVRGGFLEGEPYFCKLLVKKLIRELEFMYIDENRKNGSFAPIVGAGLLAMGLRSHSDIEKGAGDFLDRIRNLDWAKPILPNIPD